MLAWEGGAGPGEELLAWGGGAGPGEEVLAWGGGTGGAGPGGSTASLSYGEHCSKL